MAKNVLGNCDWNSLFSVLPNSCTPMPPVSLTGWTYCMMIQIQPTYSHCIEITMCVCSLPCVSNNSCPTRASSLLSLPSSHTAQWGGASHLLHQVAETRAYVVLLVCVSSHACTAQGAVSIQMLVFACEEEGVGWLFSDSWVSWCELRCVPAAPFGQCHPSVPNSSNPY